MKKPIPTADRPDVNAAAAFLEQLLTHWAMTSERADEVERHARALRRIGCRNRAGHQILRHDGHCAECGCSPADDEVQP